MANSVSSRLFNGSLAQNIHTTYVTILKNSQQLIPLIKLLQKASNEAKKVTNLHA